MRVRNIGNAQHSVQQRLENARAEPPAELSDLMQRLPSTVTALLPTTTTLAWRPISMPLSAR